MQTNPNSENKKTFKIRNQSSYAIPVWWLKELHEEWARCLVWLRTGHVDWFTSGLLSVYQKCDACGCLDQKSENPIEQLQLVWSFIVRFYHSGHTRKINALRKWLLDEFHISNYLNEYSLDNFTEQLQQMDIKLKERSAEKVSIEISSPLYDPYQVDEEPVPFAVVPESLCQQEQQLIETRSRKTSFNLMEDYNEFADDSDRMSDTPVAFNDEYTCEPVSPPSHPKRKLYSPRHCEWSYTVEEKELDSPKPESAKGVFTGYVSLNDPFVYYTSPPGYPYIQPRDPTPPHQQTPLANEPLDLSFTDKTNRPWNRLRHKPVYRKWISKMKAKAQAKLERRNDDEKKDPDTLAIFEEPEKELKEKCDDFFRQVVPARETPILLYGGVKEAIPPHMRNHTRRVSDNIHSSLGSWFYRNVQHYTNHRGAGFIEHFYRLNTPSPFPVTEHLAGVATRITKYAMQHAVQSTHRNYRGGLIPRLQMVFRRSRGGAYRRSRVISTMDMEALELMLRGLYLDTLEERHTGMDDEEDDSDLYGLRILVPEHEYEGGCDSVSHTHNWQDYKIITMKSKGNNCGIGCLLYYTNLHTQHNTIRKKLGIALDTPLSFTQLEKVADYIDVGFRIWQEEGGVLNTIYYYKLNREIITDILFNHITKHYSILELLDEKRQCTLCGRYIRNKKKHTCDSRRVNFYRQFKTKDLKPVAEYKTLKDPPRNMNSVYVFDLETFPEKDNIHTVYACKTQCVGTQQEWLGYGEGVECMNAILRLSEKYMPVEYKDANPDSDTGHFEYKTRKHFKWKKLKYSPPDYTRDEAIEEGWKCMLQLKNMDAVGQGAGYYISEDEDKQMIYVYSENERKAGEWSYSDYHSKENVLRRLQAMKDYDECVFIAHNLARFDGAFLFNYLLEKGVEPQFVINSGRIISLRWNNSWVWDTYLFIPESLKAIAKTFKCKVQKGDFDHTLIKSWDDVERFKDSSPGGMGWKIYLDYDVYSLREIVEQYSKNVFEQFGIDVFNFVTLSNMTYKLWGQSTLEQNVLVETPQKERYDFIKDAIYGGRVFPMQKEFATTALTIGEETQLEDIHRLLDAGTPLDEIKYEPEEIKNMWQKCWDAGSFLMNMDMNSLYPTGMCMEYPIGVGEWSVNPERDFRKGYIGIYEIEFEPPSDIIMAILPQRERKYISAKEDKKLNKQWKSSSIRWSLEPTRGVYTSVDIELALKYKYKIKFLSRAMIWKERGKVFEPYIKQIYKLKKAQDQLEGTDAYNPILRGIAKNMMNSLFGKTCQKPIQDKQQIIKSENEFYTFAKDYEITDYVWVNLDGKDCLAVSGSPAEVENRKPSHFGAFVLAYSRKIMTEDFDRCCNGLKDCNFTYTDTDSIHMYGHTYKQMLQTYPERFGDEIGQFSNDIKGKDPIIVYEYSLAPKCYVYVYITSDGKVGLKKKVKGLPKQIMKQISMDDFAEEKTKTLSFDSMKRNLFSKDKEPFSIENTKAERTFLKNKYSRMLYIEETKQFRPFGYLNIQDEKEPEPEPVLNPQPEIKSHRVYETNLPDKWYFKQEPAIHLSKSRLVCWMNVVHNKETRHYTRLEIKDMTKVLYRMKDDGAYLYEVTEDACRLFCDVDLSRKFDDETEPGLILQQVCDCMIRAAQKFGVILRLEDLKILSACTEKKFSFHISSPAHVFPSPKHQQNYWEACTEISKQYPLLWRDDQPAFDLPIYHKHRCMRTIYSRKPKKQILEPITPTMEVLDLKEEEIEEYFVVVEPNQTNWSALSKAPELKKIKRHHGSSLVIKPGGTLPQDVQDLLQANKDKLEGYNLETGLVGDAILKLQRIGPGECSTCKRTHTHDSGYVKLGTKPYFVCFRNPKEKLYLTGVGT